MGQVPWRYVNNWQCNGCGLCCRKFNVVLKFNEWLKLVRAYGVETTGIGLDRLYLGKRSDGTCVFLTASKRVCFCGLQNMKPMACKLWPFKILDRPKYGRTKEASFNYKGRSLYIYIDSVCPEITWGKPSAKMTYHIIPEFIEIALGSREKQFYSTGTPLYDLYPKTKNLYRLI